MYLGREDSSYEGSAVDLSDVSSCRHVDGVELFNGVHLHHQLSTTFGVVPPDHTHTHDQLTTHTLKLTTQHTYTNHITSEHIHTHSASTSHQQFNTQ